jgi:alpha-beta hydrolase superfamily lysophospholipase
MSESIESRELIELVSREGVLRGTCHMPSSKGPMPSIARDRLGVLFLNGLPATRAGHGDAAVYWAESLARLGYPAFRVDLPGYGDSCGDPPPEALSSINRGGYKSIVLALVRELVERFKLSGVVLVGHCAGAVTAIYTAASTRECRGLVLIDPYFYLPQQSDRSLRKRLIVWTMQSRFGRAASTLYRFLKMTRLRLNGLESFKNANLPLLARWKEAASSGMPILILKAAPRRNTDTPSQIHEFADIGYALELAGRKSRVAAKVIVGAHHSFANELARTAVQQNIEGWLEASFPQGMNAPAPALKITGPACTTNPEVLLP